MATGTELTIFDRALIEVYLDRGYGINQIAKLLGRHRSTIYREVGRCRKQNPRSSRYDYKFAQELHDINITHRKRNPLLKESRTVIDMIDSLIKKEGLSPKDAVVVAKQAGIPETVPCVNTVYRYIDKGMIDATADDLPRSRAVSKDLDYENLNSSDIFFDYKEMQDFCYIHGYSLVQTSVINDTSLSPSARLLMITILSLPNDFKITVKGICSIINGDDNEYRGYSLKSIYALFKELQQAGYIVKEQQRDGDGQYKSVKYSLNKGKLRLDRVKDRYMDM